MMKTILLITAFGLLLTACSQTEEENTRIPEAGGVSFSGSVAASSRATDTAFESGDQISVFAFKDASGFQTESIYATNKKYTYCNLFTAIDANNAIVYPEDKGALSFQAIYPYLESAGASFTFNVKEDQSVAGNYTLSDLMTASTVSTTKETPSLQFAHRLANIEVNLSFAEVPAGTINVSILNVTTTASVDMITGSFKSTGEQTKQVKAATNGTNGYKAILPPQAIQAGTTLIVITTEYGDAYTWKMPKTTEWRSGIRYAYTLTIDKEGEVTFTSSINPWEEDSEDNPAIDRNLLIGKWEMINVKGWEIVDDVKEEFDESISDDFWTFNEDGAGYNDYIHENSGSKRDDYNWSLQGSILSLIYNGYTENFNVKSKTSTTVELEYLEDPESYQCATLVKL